MRIQDCNNSKMNLTRRRKSGAATCVPTFAVDDMMSDEIMSGLQFFQDDDLVQQMGAEVGIMTQREVDLHGGNLSDVMVGANWPKSFVEELMNDEQPNTMEVGDWNVGYLDFGYFEF
ncbi:hypothetical protein M0R45_025533 [Rubus argutus]|uniref:Uncharacterized protein n=1 Tax=Rubus argutus TaxID=59490 RepID=A0AAW1WUY7_RUBAR